MAPVIKGFGGRADYMLAQLDSKLRSDRTDS